MPENEAERDGYNFIDLFAGAGGLSEGFIQAGFNPVTHVEMNEFAARTLTTRTAYYYLKEEDNLNLYYRYLRGEITRDEFLAEIPDEILDTVICETLSKKTIPGVFQTIDEALERKHIDHVDVIVGGPPCQAYSLVGRAQSSHMEIPMKDDPRNELYKLYARLRLFIILNKLNWRLNHGKGFTQNNKYREIIA